MKPYYQAPGVTLYHGDSRDVLPTLKGPNMAERGPEDVVVLTDPVWSNAHPDLVGAADPAGLFADVAALFPAFSSRCVIQLGRDSDPRVLASVPHAFAMLCVCWIRRTPPGYKGDILVSADVAYIFGHRRRPRGVTLFPGEAQAASRGARPDGVTHPCARNEQGVAWLLKWFVPEGCVVVDPFAGSCTTLVCAYRRGVPVIGVEIDERWCEEGARRLENEARQGHLGLEIQAVQEAAERP